MLAALHRYPRAERPAVAREWARRSNAAQSAARIAREPDADTLRRRALHDARGQLIREGRTYSAAGAKHWRVIRSLRGRTDQRDVIVDGQLIRTCGPRRLPAWLR
jgi:hypothetical protein